MTYIYFLCTKAAIEVSRAFQDFKAAVENAAGLRI
jgi:hypothetical protein